MCGGRGPCWSLDKDYASRSWLTASTALRSSDAPPDALAEYDAEETVDGILQALRDAGHSPFFLEADETLLDTVRETRPDICFNIAEGLRGDARESPRPGAARDAGDSVHGFQGC